LIVSLSFVEMFFRIENTNIGGDVGLIRISNSWMYAAIFSLMVLLISLVRKIVSLSAIFSMSKSWASSSNCGRLYCCCISS